MSEIRQNLVTGESVVIATERAKRPKDFAEERPVLELPPFDPRCPFCPGNESQTERELYRIGDDMGWKVRIVANRFPVLEPCGGADRKVNGIWHSIRGVGVHDVVIETPVHNLATAQLSVGELHDVLTAYTARYRQIMSDGRVELVIIFKNHGEAAGTSLVHPHSQIIGVPIIPSQVKNRVRIAQDYFDAAGECLFCRILHEESESAERIVAECGSFIAFVPYAALSPFHTWMLPKRHMSSFGSMEGRELEDLAFLLKVVLSKFYYGLGNPSFNYCIRTSPEGGESAYFHWYLSIVPRLTKAAGFELGSGMYVNTSLPESDAEILRDVEVSVS